MQYQQLLSDEGFPVTASSNMHSHNIPLVKAIVYSASYPNVVMNPWTAQFTLVSHSSLRPTCSFTVQVAVRCVDNSAKPRFLSSNYCSLKPHPKSVCASSPSGEHLDFSTPWCTFVEKV